MNQDDKKPVPSSSLHAASHRLEQLLHTLSSGPSDDSTRTVQETASLAAEALSLLQQHPDAIAAIAVAASSSSSLAALNPAQQWSATMEMLTNLVSHYSCPSPVVAEGRFPAAAFAAAATSSSSKGTTTCAPVEESDDPIMTTWSPEHDLFLEFFRRSGPSHDDGDDCDDGEQDEEDDCDEEDDDLHRPQSSLWFHPDTSTAADIAAALPEHPSREQETYTATATTMMDSLTSSKGPPRLFASSSSFSSSLSQMIPQQILLPSQTSTTTTTQALPSSPLVATRSSPPSSPPLPSSTVDPRPLPDVKKDRSLLRRPTSHPVRVAASSGGRVVGATLQHRPLAPPPALMHPSQRAASERPIGPIQRWVDASSSSSSRSIPTSQSTIPASASASLTRPSGTVSKFSEAARAGTRAVTMSYQARADSASSRTTAVVAALPASTNSSNEDTGSSGESQPVTKLPQNSRRWAVGEDNESNQSSGFPFKLYQMLVDADAEGKSDIISFTPSGRAFQIHQPNRLLNELVPRYFSQKKITSFKRTLGAYGFERIPRGPEEGGYFHTDFQKGKPELLHTIKRAKRGMSTAKKGAWEPDFTNPK